MRRRLVISPLLIFSLAIAGPAQTKPRLTPADYGKWETLGSTNLSPDGKWLAYVVNRSNRNNELRIVSASFGEPKVASFGSPPVSSSDSRRVAYSIGHSETQEEKLKKEKTPIHRKLGLLHLASGERAVLDGVESFAFSANGAYLTMRHYATGRIGAPRVPEAFSSGFDSAAQQGGDDAFQFFLREVSFDNRWVIDAPFSADAVTEMNQILPDGKRIVQRVEGRVYRDSQGRTRNERTFHVEGSSEQKQTITIHDILIHVSYTFDPETKIARKMNTYIKQIDTPPQPPPSTVVPLPLRASVYSEATTNISDLGGVLLEKAIRRVQPEYSPIAKAAGASGAVQVDITISHTGEVYDAEVHSGHLLLRDAAVQAARQWLFKPTEIGGVPVIVHGILTFNFMLNDQKNASAPIARSVTNYTINTEQLGEQMVDRKS